MTEKLLSNHKNGMPVMLALYPLTAFGNWLAVAFYKLRRW